MTTIIPAINEKSLRLAEFDVSVKVSLKIDAPTKEEAERYAEVFAGDAVYELCKAGCNPGDGFSEDTGIVYSGFEPVVQINLI